MYLQLLWFDDCCASPSLGGDDDDVHVQHHQGTRSSFGLEKMLATVVVVVVVDIYVDGDVFRC